MPEIKTGILKLSEGQEYIPGPNEYVITEEHSIADIARFILAHGYEEDLQYFLKEEGK